MELGLVIIVALSFSVNELLPIFRLFCYQWHPVSESTPEGSSMKIWSVKSLPGEKRLEFLPPWQYCIWYFTPGKTPHRIPVNFWISPDEIWCYPCDINDTTWYLVVSLWNYGNARYCFCWLLRWARNWCHLLEKFLIKTVLTKDISVIMWD